jgi:superfamily II DNA or RNA helicase
MDNNTESVKISELDSVFIRIDAEKSVMKEMSQFFSFEVPNHKYMPAYRNRVWNGRINLLNVHKHTIYRGLLGYVKKFCKDRNYSVSGFEEEESKIEREHLCKFLDEFVQPHIRGEKAKVHDYQIDAIFHAIKRKRCLLLSPTGSGKSMIIYCLMRYYLEILPKDKKILIIVPTTGLVQQMISDFAEYSKNTKWRADKNCHGIHAGRSKETAKRVVISTWQSIFREPKEWFDQFSVVFGDECHQYRSQSLVGLMTKLKNCPYRVGTTGTLDSVHVHKLIIEGLLGPVYKVTSTKDLIDKNILSELKVECLSINHSDTDRAALKRRTYQEEIEWIVTDERRNKFIVQLAEKLKGNTLILFNYVEKQGKPLFKMLERSNKNIYFIYGKTETEMREQIRKIVDKDYNSIMVASYGTTSTGINIRNIHNIIFASPSKSVIRVLQSIGRGLRKSETKENVVIYDISDDLRYKKYNNHTYNHLQERLRIYTKERFSHRLVSITLEESQNGTENKLQDTETEKR